jgi:hypothetical protein
MAAFFVENPKIICTFVIYIVNLSRY